MKYLKYTVTSVILSLVSYGAYLFGNDGLDRLFVLVFVGMWVHFTYMIIKQDLAVEKEMTAMDKATIAE